MTKKVIINFGGCKPKHFSFFGEGKNFMLGVVAQW